VFVQYIHSRIKGTPYGQNKSRGNTEAPAKWTEAVIQQTSVLPKISEACLLKVTFILPEDKFPKDFPYGPDLDNLLKRFLDALNHTIFSDSRGKDSCIISITATKTRATEKEEAGAVIEILPVAV
jgi:Holliday junction resolvase RusA-like endonuclease